MSEWIGEKPKDGVVTGYFDEASDKTTERQRRIQKCGNRCLPRGSSKRRDFFAMNAPAVPEWYMREYIAKFSFSETDAMASGILLDAEVQWRWEFAAKMIENEWVRR